MRWPPHDPPPAAGPDCPPPGFFRGGNGGFTLLETLAAFVVLALLAIAMQQGVVTASSSMARAQGRVGAEFVAASLLTGPIGTLSTSTEPMSGQMNGYAWTVRTELLPPGRFGIGAPARAPAWVPVRLLVDVRQPGSRSALVTAETVRLVPAAP